MKKEVNTTNGVGLSGVVFIVFLVLKLCGLIDWSWWWVTAPLWIPLCLFILIFVIVLLFATVWDKEE